MEEQDMFVQACRETFRFLEEEWGFTPEPPEIFPLLREQSYVNPDLRIRIDFYYDVRDRYVDASFLRYPDGRPFGGFEQPEWLPSQEFARFPQPLSDTEFEQLQKEYAPLSEWERLGLRRSRKRRYRFAEYNHPEEVIVRFQLGFFAFVFKKLGWDLIDRLRVQFGLQ